MSTPTVTTEAAPNPYAAMLEPILAAQKDNIANYNTAASAYQAMSGDRDAALDAWMKSSDDAVAVKCREVIEQATARLRQAAEQAYSAETQYTDEDKAKASKELDEQKKVVRDGFSALKKLIDAFDIKDVKLPDDPTKGANAGNGSGSSLPRANVIVRLTNDHSTDSWTFDNMSKAAAHVSWDLEDFQKAFADAAGVEHADISKVKDEVTFDLPPAVNSKVIWTVHTSPKETKPRGRQAVTAQPDAKPESVPAVENTVVNAEENGEKVEPFGEM